MSEPTFENIDYSFRPASYSQPQDALQAILVNVQGACRRRMIRDYWAAGRLDGLADVLLKDVLPEDARRDFGALHPAFMGGEYLPGFKVGEFEIARIELQSVMADVTSIRARARGKRILYSIHDEYETEFEVSPASSSKPLNLQQVIGLIDAAGEGQSLALQYTAMNFGSYDGSEKSLNELKQFTTVESVFYPQLSLHYALLTDSWLAEQLKQRGEGGKR